MADNIYYEYLSLHSTHYKIIFLKFLLKCLYIVEKINKICVIFRWEVSMATLLALLCISCTLGKLWRHYLHYCWNCVEKTSLNLKWGSLYSNGLITLWKIGAPLTSSLYSRKMWNVTSVSFVNTVPTDIIYLPQKLVAIFMDSLYIT